MWKNMAEKHSKDLNQIYFYTLAYYVKTLNLKH